MATLASNQQKDDPQLEQKLAERRAEFANKLHMNCRLLVTHFEELLNASKIQQHGDGGHRPGDADALPAGAPGASSAGENAINEVASERALRLGEQERLRRDGLHVAVHAENISAVAADLLGQIQDLRLNLIMGDTEGIQSEIAEVNERAAAGLEQFEAVDEMTIDGASSEREPGRDAMVTS